VVWCNAYSEATGKTPAYKYGGAVLRESEDSRTSGGAGKAEQVDIIDANGYRLPTEAQWEYAARGGDPNDATKWGYIYAGSNEANDVAVYNYDTSSTAPVKSKIANRLGLYDMSGNVWEWCQDIVWDPSRVLRGGCWRSIATECDVACRSNLYPDFKSNNIGFRVVCP
jgi:formylglycine-generating enzyme required for sulfatase activity